MQRRDVIIMCLKLIHILNFSLAFRFTIRGYKSLDKLFHIFSKFLLICENRWKCFT